MTPKACSPYPEPSLIGEFREEYGLLADLFGDVRVPGPGKWLEASEGVDLKYAKLMNSRLQAMWGIPLDKVFEHLNGKVWNIVDKDGVQVPTRINLSPQQQGAWAGVFADYLYGKAAGIRQMADNFIAASSTPEGGLTQGLQLARQLQFMGQLGEITMGLQQATGLGVRVQGLRSGLGRVADDIDLREAAQQAASAREFNDRLKMIADLLKDPRKSSEGMRLLLGEAERVKFMNDPISIVKGATGYKLAGNAWNEWTINSMLSNPATWMTNAAGVLWAPMRAGAQLLGAGMYNVAAGAGLADPAAARELWAMSTGQLMGMKAAFNDAMIISWEALKSGRSLYDNWALDGSPDLRAITGANVQQGLQKLGVDEISAGQKQFFDVLGNVIRTPSRMLLAADEFAKIIAQRGEVAQRGIKRAFDAGVDPSDTAAWKAYMEAEAKAAFEVRPDGTFGKYGRLTEAYDGASALQEGFGGRTIKRVGDEATFQEPNAVAKGINNMVRKAPYLKPFVPFVKTPTNILKQGLTETTLIGPILKLPGIVQSGGLTPTGIILEIQKQALKNPTETARITGQITFMTGVMSTLYMMAMEGSITGGGPGRWGQGTSQQQRLAQQAWERANVPYSIKVGDTFIPFDRWPEPVATFMRMAADLGGASAYMTEEEKDGAIGTLVGVGVAGLYNSSMLRGIDQLISTIKNPGEFNQRMGANVQYWFATQSPLGGLMSYVDQIEDPYRSAYQESGLQYLLSFEEIFGRGVLGKVAERFPGGSSVRPVQIDPIYGQPVPVSPGFGPNGLNPLFKAIPFLPRTLEGTHDEAWKAVLEMTNGFDEYSPSGVELTVGQQQRLNESMGTRKIGGKTLAQRLMELRRRPDVEEYVRSKGSAPPETGTGIANEVSALKTEYGQSAFQELLSNDINLRQQQALQTQLKQYKKDNNLRGARTVSQQLQQLLKIADRD